MINGIYSFKSKVQFMCIVNIGLNPFDLVEKFIRIIRVVTKNFSNNFNITCISTNCPNIFAFRNKMK